MLRRPASRYAERYGFGRVLHAVPVPWDLYSVVVTAIFPAIIVVSAIASALNWTAGMWPVLIFFAIFAVGAVLGWSVFRGRGIVVCENGILVGSFTFLADVMAARWDQIELDSLRSYTNIKRAFLLRHYTSQRAPQVGTSSESHGIAFVGPALAEARPQGIAWWQRRKLRASFAKAGVENLEGASFWQVWAVSVRQADVLPIAQAIADALAGVGIEGGDAVVEQLATPARLPKTLPGAHRTIYETALEDGLLAGEPFDEGALQRLIMYQAVSMRPQDRRPL